VGLGGWQRHAKRGSALAFFAGL